jgi:Zn-dependent protease with chaperone function
MPFLLMVFLTVVCLPAWQTQDRTGWVSSPVLSAALTWLGVALVAAESAWSAWRVRRAVGRDPARRERISARYERVRFWRQFFLIGVFALAVYGFNWGWAVVQLWNWGGPDPQHLAPLPGAKMLLLAPFFAGLVLSWVFSYDADRALYLAAYRQLDSEGLARAFADGGAAALDPAREFGGRWSYVLFQGRQKLALVFLPVVLLLVQQEISLQIPQDAEVQWEWLLTTLGAAGVLAVLVALPWMVRAVLGLKPLPPGPVRDRLLAASRRLHFRCSDLLLWNTRGGMANAMVIGVLPWPRYVIFTDRFLEEFSGDEVEAVFGHEVGHVKHRHMLYYLAFLLLSIAAMGYGFVAAYPLLPNFGGGPPAPPTLASVLYGLPLTDAWVPAGAAVFLVYLFAVFGYLSRRCERQADVFGCRTVSCRRPECVGHDDRPELAAGAAALCPTGVRTFIYALEKVAQVNGISRDRPGFLQSWQHGSIARRVTFLYGLLKDPAAERRFQRRVAYLKWGLIATLGAALVVFVVLSPPTLTAGQDAPKVQKAAPEQPPADAAPGTDAARS